MTMIDHLIESGIKSLVFWATGLVLVWFTLTVLVVNLTGLFPSVEKVGWQAVFLTND